MLYVRHRSASVMIKEFLLNLLFGEKGRFLWMAGVCAILYGSCGVSGTIGCLRGWIGILGRFYPLPAFMSLRGLRFERPFVIIL